VKTLIGFGLILSSYLALADAPATQNNCGPSSNIPKIMEKFHEVAVFEGVRNAASGKHQDDLIVLITMNLDTKTWTKFVINQQGYACVLDAGTNAVLPKLPIKIRLAL